MQIAFIPFTISSLKQVYCYCQFPVTKLILVLFLSGDVFISKHTVILRRPRWSCTRAATRSKSTRIQQNVLIPDRDAVVPDSTCSRLRCERGSYQCSWSFGCTFSCQEYINLPRKWISITGFSCIKANVQQRKKLISARHRRVCLKFALKKKK